MRWNSAWCREQEIGRPQIQKTGSKTKNAARIFITGSADGFGLMAAKLLMELNEGSRTQAWLAVSDEPLARKTGEYFYHQKLRLPNPQTRDIATQEELLTQCQKLSGVALPR